MQRNWSYPEFRAILEKEAKEGEDRVESSIYKRLYSYMKALELRRRGLSYGDIRKIIRAELQWTPSKGELSEWLRGIHTPLGNVAVFDVRRPEVGLILGLILSDGDEYPCQGGYRENFYNTDPRLLMEFSEAAENLGLKAWRRERLSELQVPYSELEVKSTLAYLLLKRYDEFIVKAPSQVQLAFLRGLWLGDGSLRSHKFANTDLRLIEVVEELPRKHHIEFTRQGPHPNRGLGEKLIYYVHVLDNSWHLFRALTQIAESPPRSACKSTV